MAIRNFVFHNAQYKYHDGTGWIIQGSTVTESDYLLNGMTDVQVASVTEIQWQELTGIVELNAYEDDVNKTEISFDIETEPFTLADEFSGQVIKVIEYTDNPTQTESATTIETDPFSFYSEMGNSMDILYYTDNLAKTSAELELTANYSPIDEIVGDFEVVTWTNEVVEGTVRTLIMSALPQAQFVKQLNPSNTYGSLQDIITTEVNTGGTNGVIRYLLSADGTTFKKWNGTSFTAVDISNIANVASQGMTLAEINTITPTQWNQWADATLYVGVYLDEDVREKTKAYVNSISYKSLIPKESTKISDAKLYILNTTSTINVTFAGNTITGTIDDADVGKVQYRVLLNGAPYFPADGLFTPLMASPLDVSLTLSNDDVLIDVNNTLRVEFQDYWGATDYWETNFIGTYSGLLFLNGTGQYYSTDVGEVLQYLDFGVIIAGQTTIEQAIVVRNTYGYSVTNIGIRANQTNFPIGMTAQFGTSQIAFEALNEIVLPTILLDGGELTFYLRLTTQLGVTPQAIGEFDIIITVDKI